MPVLTSNKPVSSPRARACLFIQIVGIEKIALDCDYETVDEQNVKNDLLKAEQ